MSRFENGNPGGPGRPKGSVDRVKAVLDGIVLSAKNAKLKGENPQELVAAWIDTLDPKMKAMLYSKVIPREQKTEMTGEITVTGLIDLLEK